MPPPEPTTPPVAASLRARISAALRRETYALPVDIFRILVGLLASVYFLSLAVQASDFSAADGFLDHDVLLQIFWYTRLNLFQPGLGTTFFHVLYGVAALASWGIVIGHRPRLVAGVLYVVAVCAYRWNFVVMYVDDSFMHLLLFWLVLLPVGHTMRLGALLRHGWAASMERWRPLTVPGTAVWCFLGNMCLVYLVAGLWKLESPMWHDGFALYATLRLPIAYFPDLWQPQHLPLIRPATFAALVVEIVLPVLLLLPKGHPLKWAGLLGQIGFHMGIVLTLRIPFANLGCMASAVLFFREEIMDSVVRTRVGRPALGRSPAFDRAGRWALALLVLLTLAMMRRLPVIGVVHQPAYAILWGLGFAQDYQLFNWIDRKNLYARHEVWEVIGSRSVRLPDEVFFPSSLRAVLLQSYVHDVRWIPVPVKDRELLKETIVRRMSDRACRGLQVEGTIEAWSTVQAITQDDPALTKGERRLISEFRCRDGRAVLCRTIAKPERAPECG